MQELKSIKDLYSLLSLYCQQVFYIGMDLHMKEPAEKHLSQTEETYIGAQA